MPGGYNPDKVLFVEFSPIEVAYFVDDLLVTSVSRFDMWPQRLGFGGPAGDRC
jgi:hypothetical protein